MKTTHRVLHPRSISHGNTEDNDVQGNARPEPAVNRIEVAAVSGAMARRAISSFSFFFEFLFFRLIFFFLRKSRVSWPVALLSLGRTPRDEEAM